MPGQSLKNKAVAALRKATHHPKRHTAIMNTPNNTNSEVLRRLLAELRARPDMNYYHKPMVKMRRPKFPNEGIHLASSIEFEKAFMKHGKRALNQQKKTTHRYNIANVLSRLLAYRNKGNSSFARRVARSKILQANNTHNHLKTPINDNTLETKVLNVLQQHYKNAQLQQMFQDNLQLNPTRNLINLHNQRMKETFANIIKKHTNRNNRNHSQ